MWRGVAWRDNVNGTHARPCPRVRSVDTSFRAWVDVFLFPRFVPPIVVDLHPRATGPQLLMISAENWTGLASLDYNHRASCQMNWSQ